MRNSFFTYIKIKTVYNKMEKNSRDLHEEGDLKVVQIKMKKI